MSIFLDCKDYKTEIKKMFETNKGYFINGQYHDKKTLTPIPFRQYPVEGESKSLSLSKNIYLDSGLGYKNNYQSAIIKDDKDQNVSYCFCKYGPGYLYPYKVIEDGYDIKVMVGENLSGSNACFKRFVDQDEDFLYIVYNYYNSGTIDTLTKIRKADLKTIKNYYQNYYSNYKILKTTATEITLLRFNNDYQSFEVVTVNKNSLDGNNIALAYPKEFSTAYSDGFNHRIELTEPVVKDQTAVLYGFIGIDNSKKTESLIKITIYLDKIINKKDFYKIELIKTDLGLLEGEKIIAEADVNYIIDNYLEEKEGSKYITVVHLSTQLEKNADDKDKTCGIFTFSLKDEGSEGEITATLTHAEQFKPVCRNYLRMSNGNIVTANSGEVDYYKWNNSIQGYKLANTIDIKPVYVGLNEFEEVFIIDEAHKVYMCSPISPTDITMNFEQDYYEYEGQDISSYVEFEIKNFEGKNLEKTVTLSLTGDVVFTANGKKEIKEKSSSLGKKSVAITIKGSSHFSVMAKYDE